MTTTSKLVWEARTRDDIVTYNVINQIMRTTSAKHNLIDDYLTTGSYAANLFNNFVAHLSSLHGLAVPLMSPLPKEEDICEKLINARVDIRKKVKPALRLYVTLLAKLQDAGIWNLTRQPALKKIDKGANTARGR